jgi:glycosyltransferase 2 family protein
MVLKRMNWRQLSRGLLLIGGTVLGVVLFVLLLRSVDLGRLGSDFSNAEYAVLIIAAPLFLINFFLRIPRWGLLFGKDPPNFDTLFGATNVGYAINFLLPARLGDIVRAYWIRDRTDYGMFQTLSTIALERVTDGMTLVLLLVIMAPTVAFPRKLLGPALLVGAGFVVAFVVMMVLAYGATRDGHPLSRFLTRLEAGRGAVIAGIVRQLAAGLRVLHSTRAILLLVGYTAGIWASNSILLWLVLKAFHIEVPVTAGFLLTAVLNLGMAVPSTPGYIGVYDFLFVLMFQLYHMPKKPALAAALGMHAIAFIPFAVVGIVYLARAGVQMTGQLIRESASLSEGEAVGESEARHMPGPTQ